MMYDKTEARHPKRIGNEDAAPSQFDRGGAVVRVGLRLIVAFAAATAGSVAAEEVRDGYGARVERSVDLPSEAESSSERATRKIAYEWTGLYAGGHFGYGGGGLGDGANPTPLQGVVFPTSSTGLIGGFQIGYNYQLNSNFVLGLEADASFTSPIDRPSLTAVPFNSAVDYVGTVRGRLGYAYGRWLPYVTAGFAWGHSHLDLNSGSSAQLGSDRAGWTAGMGAEVRLSANWSAKLEYNYVDLSSANLDLSRFGLADSSLVPSLHLVKGGLNYHFDAVSNTAAQLIQPAAPSLNSDSWNVHAQTTFIGQGYPAFRSPYSGANSLPGGGQVRETWTTTAFLGVRLWEGGEFYFNPETAQGFGLNGTLGLAGFSNGEAQKAGAAYPKIRPQRYYIKQTFGLGGEQEEVADGPNQLSGKRDIDRITLVVGRFAIGDFFDNNAYAHDPRADFMNWALWSSAAYDFPADLPGYTRGAVIELNRKEWAVRAAVVQVPSAPNSDVLNFNTGGAVVEFEQRYTIGEQAGKLRLGAFGNQGNAANYRQVLAVESQNVTQDIDTVTANLRHVNSKYGFYVNLEQQIATDVGLFGRASWNDGQAETLSFTDIDRSISGGLSIKGSYWGRQADTLGIGVAINGLSAAHRDFLAAGGTGLLIGDGALNYGTERILESYYAWSLGQGRTLTADYQLIVNPAYNADRGPVSVVSGRLHAEF
ncbi:carbohydrate porin [Rhodopseudomonas sp. P1]|uniref:carbohydrate porin n=1 Tax=Rhodopseudomonas sp. P1 TaxID=3434357 RepID=UPI0031FE388D